MEMYRREYCDGIYFRGIKDTRFKTMRISVHMIVPVNAQTASANAIVPFLLIRSVKEYPDFTKLNRHLAELYGASLSANVERNGSLQILSISISSIADRFALHGENLSLEMSKLICSAVFDPLFDENGQFDKKGFEIEKRQTLEQIDAELNDKRTYARQRCVEIMLKKEIPCISRYGERKSVEKLEYSEISKAWKELIKKSRIEIFASGDCNVSSVYDFFMPYIKDIKRDYTYNFDFRTSQPPYEKNDVKEDMDVIQSKLVMGFRTGTNDFSKKTNSIRLIAAILGGTPSSKLFLNVREKKGLCYYCGASFYSSTGTVLIDSGVEPSNSEKAKDEILKQLECLKKGELSDDEISACQRLSLKDSYNTIFDYIAGMENWYLYRTFHDEILTPSETANIISGITREEIIEAANLCELSTVYLLSGGLKNE